MGGLFALLDKFYTIVQEPHIHYQNNISKTAEDNIHKKP